MNQKTNEELQTMAEKATAGDREALEVLVAGVQDMVFNLSLRMLGTFADAEDATQDILLKMITHLSTFRGESAFTTWVFRIAVNHLKNYKKHMFAHAGLSFAYYGEDIENGKIQDVPDVTQNVEKDFLGQYCGEYGSGRCRCKDRVNYAIQNHRINPLQLCYTTAEEAPVETMLAVKNAMEQLDDLSIEFSFCKAYWSTGRTKQLIQELLNSPQFSLIRNS